MRRARRRSALSLTATALVATSAAAVAQEQSSPAQGTPEQSAQQQGGELPPAQVQAVLKSHEVHFVYRSSVNPLSCDQLRNSIAVILREVGARDDIQVKANECKTFIPDDPRSTPNSNPSDYGNVGGNSVWDPMNRTGENTADRLRMSRAGHYDRYQSQSTPVRIQLMMPVVVTPEVVKEVERDRSRRALIAHVTGSVSAALDDPNFFVAERREITLSHDTIGLEAIHCELLEQLALSVFRTLDLRVSGQSLSCDRRKRSHFRPRLTVEALLPVGFLMPGEQRQREQAEKAAEKKASETPAQPAASP
jgi:hypothetical protein